MSGADRGFCKKGFQLVWQRSTWAKKVWILGLQWYIFPWYDMYPNTVRCPQLVDLAPPGSASVCEYHWTKNFSPRALVDSWLDRWRKLVKRCIYIPVGQHNLKPQIHEAHLMCHYTCITQHSNLLISMMSSWRSRSDSSLGRESFMILRKEKSLHHGLSFQMIFYSSKEY